MNKLDSQGFSAIEAILILIVIGLVGGAGFYVYSQSQQPSDEYNTLAENAKKEQDINDSKNLSLDESRLPDGWTIDTNDESRILLLHDTNDCYVEVLYSTDTSESNSPDVDQQKQTLESIKSKGYSVKELPADGLRIQTTEGEEDIPSQNLSMSGMENPMFQKYGYITAEAYYLRIQLSCPKEADIKLAQEALLAITIRKQDL